MPSLVFELRAFAALALLLTLSSTAAAGSPAEKDVENPFPEIWAGSPASLIRKRLEIAEALIKLRGEKDPKSPALAGLRARARSIRRSLKATPPPAAKEGPELHVVHCDSPAKRGAEGKLGGRMRVQVTRRGTVDLYLSSYHAVHWVIEPAKGVHIRRVFIAGYEAPRSFEGVDEKRVVGGITRARFEAGERQSKGWRLPRIKESIPGKVMAQQLETATELLPETAQNSRGMASLVVGPESEGWRLQFVHAEVDALFTELVVDQLAKDKVKLAALAKGWAAKFPRDPLGESSKEPPLSRLFPPRTMQQMQRRGVTLASKRGRDVEFGYEMLVEPKTRRLYVLTDHTLLVREPVSQARYGEAKEVLDLPWLSALAHDTKRGRFFLGTQHVFECLYAYEPAARKVNQLGQRYVETKGPNSFKVLSLAYDAVDDRVCAFESNAEGRLAVTPLSSDGRKEDPIIFDADQEDWGRLFFGLMPEALLWRTLRGVLLRVHDGKALLCLRASSKLRTDSRLGWPLLRLYYAVDLRKRALIAAGMEIDR